MIKIEKKLFKKNQKYLYYSKIVINFVVFF